jgi:hypothetical protein
MKPVSIAVDGSQVFITAAAGNAAKCRMSHHLLEFACTKGIEAFTLLFNLQAFSTYLQMTALPRSTNA